MALLEEQTGTRYSGDTVYDGGLFDDAGAQWPQSRVGT
jgi:hypothetical protein